MTTAKNDGFLGGGGGGGYNKKIVISVGHETLVGETKFGGGVYFLQNQSLLPTFIPAF